RRTARRSFRRVARSAEPSAVFGLPAGPSSAAECGPACAASGARTVLVKIASPDGERPDHGTWSARSNYATVARAPWGVALHPESRNTADMILSHCLAHRQPASGAGRCTYYRGNKEPSGRIGRGPAPSGRASQGQTPAEEVGLAGQATAYPPSANGRTVNPG